MAAFRAGAGGVGMSQGMGAAAATKRIQRELKEIHTTPSRHWTAAPVGDDLFEWQFAVRGPPGTDFEGGVYTGRIVLPANYPLAPPSISLLTPNGRWEVGKKICLSNTHYHPESWQPAWGIRTIVEALRSHFDVKDDGAIGAISWPSNVRQKLARESLDFVTPPGTQPNRTLLPELTPEELKEEEPVPVPELLSVPASPEGGPLADPAAAEVDAGPTAVAAPPPDTGPAPPQPQEAAAPAAVPAPPAAPAEAAAAASLEGDAEGLRQRKAAEPPSPPAAAAQSSPPAPEAPPRRRRQTQDGASGQRRQRRGLLAQLFKPPSTAYGWVEAVINLMIFLLTVSFLVVLVDLVRNPPQLLDAPPGPKED